MKRLPLLSAIALLACTPCLAQNEVIITEGPVAIPEREHDPNEPFMMVEEMPQYPGGQEALLAYIAKELKYPEEAVAEGLEGVVYVTFVVETDGNITGVKVLRGIGGGCDEEAVRVVSAMPKWTPGKQRGEAVRVKYNLPIRYKL